MRVELMGAWPLWNELLAQSLQRAGVELTGSSNRLAEVMDRLDSRAPDLVLLEARPTRAALRVTRSLRRANPRVRIVAFGLSNSGSAVDFVRAGASGYVRRHRSLQELIDTLEAVHQRQPPCSPKVAASVRRAVQELARGSSVASAEARMQLLTRREREVLQGIADGWTDKQIAKELAIALSTVKNHVHSILKKLAVTSRRRAANLARGTTRLS